MQVNCVPLIPHFYIVKLGFTGVYCTHFFLFLIQNIACGRGGSNVYPQSMFRANIKTIKNFRMEFSIVNAGKNLCIVHGHVFMMSYKFVANAKCVGKSFSFNDLPFIIL